MQRAKSGSILKKSKSLILQTEDVKEIFEEEVEVQVSDEELK